MKPPYEPWPPPNPHWPDHVKRIYAAGCERIDRLRQQIDQDGILAMPFTCYGCDRQRDDFAMLTGDGVPICVECFDGGVKALYRGTVGA